MSPSAAVPPAARNVWRPPIRRSDWRIPSPVAARLLLLLQKHVHAVAETQQTVRDRNGLLAGLLQGQAGEGMHALVGRGEGVVRGQFGLAVAAREVDRARIVG